VALRVFGKIADQARPLNNQIRPVQRNVRAAAIGEQLEFADLVDDGAGRDLTQEAAHVARHDERARRGIELVGPFEHFDRAAGARQ
jgi:hypothetical protein